jgi:biotin transport system substrate-specific component
MSAVADAADRPRVLADLLPGTWVRDGLLVSGYALVIAASAQVAIPLPFTPVPITGQTFAVLLGALALGAWRGAAGTGLYLVVGLAGVPWFAAAGPWTFGYVIGFVAAAALVGRLAERGWDRRPLSVAGAMVVGNLVIYAFGVPWLYVMWPAGTVGVVELLWAGALYFVPGDLLKIALATALMPTVWALVRRADPGA